MLTITKVKKIRSNICEIYFTSDFELTNLKAQYSLDNATWSSNIQLSGIESPQQLILPIHQSCFIRINDDDYIPPVESGKFNNKFNQKFD